MSEGACPFCGAALAASFQSSAAPVGPSTRLSRAALFAFGASAAVLGPVVVTDCGGEVAPQPLYGGSYFPEDSGVTIDAGRTMSSPPYGISPPPPDDAGEPPDSADAGTDGGVCPSIPPDDGVALPPCAPAGLVCTYGPGHGCEECICEPDGTYACGQNCQGPEDAGADEDAILDGASDAADDLESDAGDHG